MNIAHDIDDFGFRAALPLFVQNRDLQSQLLGEHSREKGDFDRVPEDVLAVTAAEVKPSDESHQFRREVGDVRLHAGALAFLFDMDFCYSQAYNYPIIGANSANTYKICTLPNNNRLLYNHLFDSLDRIRTTRATLLLKAAYLIVL